MEKTAQILKTLGHVERLRILSLLSHGELTVSELVQILGLSQPRITQYINSLESVGIIERVRRERAKAADAFFANVANDRGQLGDEYLPQSDIETKMREIAGEGPFDMMVDLIIWRGKDIII